MGRNASLMASDPARHLTPVSGSQCLDFLFNIACDSTVFQGHTVMGTANDRRILSRVKETVL